MSLIQSQDDDNQTDTTTPTTTTGTDQSTTPTGDTTSDASGDVSDYTQMQPDDDQGGANDDTQNSTQDGPTPGTDAPGTPGPDGSGAGGGTDQGDDAAGAAEEPSTDYGELSPDDDDPNANPDGGNGDGSQDGNSDGQEGEGTEDGAEGDGSDTSADDPQAELKELESKLFSDLSPEQIQIKDNELKVQFINLYEDIEKTENRVNRIVKTDSNESVVNFIIRKLEELKELVHTSLIQTYQTRTYLQNVLTYNHHLAVFASIGKMLKELSKKDKINDLLKKERESDYDIDDFISGQSSDADVK